MNSVACSGKYEANSLSKHSQRGRARPSSSATLHNRSQSTNFPSLSSLTARGPHPSKSKINSCSIVKDDPSENAKRRVFRRALAGVPGFEPGSAGTKTRCLTAWLYPKDNGMIAIDQPFVNHLRRDFQNLLLHSADGRLLQTLFAFLHSHLGAEPAIDSLHQPLSRQQRPLEDSPWGRCS